MIESLDAEIIAILQLLITYIYIDILYIKCPGHVLDITKFMSMDGTVLDIPSMDIVPSHYQHCLRELSLNAVPTTGTFCHPCNPKHLFRSELLPYVKEQTL